MQFWADSSNFYYIIFGVAGSTPRVVVPQSEYIYSQVMVQSNIFCPLNYYRFFHNTTNKFTSSTV